MRAWLGRLPFTFLLLAFYFGYMAYRVSQGQLGPVDPMRLAMYGLLSGLMGVLAVLAFRERYRPRSFDDELPRR